MRNNYKQPFTDLNGEFINDCDSSLDPSLIKTPQNISFIGFWSYEFSHKKLSWSSEVYKILNVTKHSSILTCKFFLDRVHPNDRDLIIRAYKNSFKNKNNSSFICRIPTSAGMNYLSVQFQTCFNHNGTPEKLAGCVLDITNKASREKKLVGRLRRFSFLYTFLEMVCDNYPNLNNIYANTIKVIKDEWRDTKNTEIILRVYDRDYSTKKKVEKSTFIAEEIKAFGENIGELKVLYTGENRNYTEIPFSNEKITLLKEVAVRLGKVTEKSALLKHRDRYVDHLESEVSERTIQLNFANEKINDETSKNEKYLKELENKTIALKVVLCELEKDKNKIREDVAINVEQNIKPILKKLQEKRGDENKLLISLDEMLNNINSDFYRTVENLNRKLSPTEIKIAHLVKSGYTTKEIAEIQNISFGTVKNHLGHIRKKLNLTNTGKSLKSYFLT